MQQQSQQPGRRPARMSDRYVRWVKSWKMYSKKKSWLINSHELLVYKETKLLLSDLKRLLKTVRLLETRKPHWCSSSKLKFLLFHTLSKATKNSWVL